MKTTFSHTAHRDILNVAIRRVLTTPLKRYCEQEYSIVKNAGYSIRKEGRGEDGYFVITNPNNGFKVIYLTSHFEYDNDLRRHEVYALHSEVNISGKQKHYKRKTPDDLMHIDFVAILDTPINGVYSRIVASEAWGRNYGLYSNSSREKARELNSARWSVNYAQGKVKEKQDKIKRLAKEIQDLTAELPDLMAEVEERKMRLEKVRKELGLA